MSTKISLGILAHNEEESIGTLLSDLQRQLLFADPGLMIDLHVVANGCRDKTVSIAERALSPECFRGSNVHAYVHDLEKSGKAYAWNEFVHRLVDQRSEYVFLLDADIRIPENTTLSLMLDTLVGHSEAVVAVDESVKDLTDQPSRTLVERLIMAASGTSNDTKKSLAGALYCARFEKLKDIWMPYGLPGEDGFLLAMLLTDQFRQEEDPDRIVFVPNARHIFESEKTIPAVFRHNVRLGLGTALNILLFEHIREFRAERGTGADLGAYIRSQNELRPDWINDLVGKKRRNKKYFLANKSIVLNRFRRLARLPPDQAVKKGPIYLLAGVFDICVFLAVNRLMRQGVGAGYW